MFLTEIFILSLALLKERSLSSLFSLPLLAPPTIYIEKKEREKKRKRARERRRARVFLLCVCGEMILKQNKNRRERERRKLSFLFSLLVRSCWLGNSPLSQKSKKALSIRTYVSSSVLSRARVAPLRFSPPKNEEELFSFSALSLFTRNTLTRTRVTKQQQQQQIKTRASSSWLRRKRRRY